MSADLCGICDQPVDSGDEPGHGFTDDGSEFPLCSVACTEAFYAPSVGERVTFREGTAPYEKNKGSVFVVDSEPLTDRTGRTGKPLAFYVWLVLAEDVDKAPSRQRRRSGALGDLMTVPDVDA